MSTDILMAIPAHLVQRVADLIVADAEGIAVAPEDLVNGWTEKTLRAHYRDSSDKMRAFLRCLADRADEEVTSREAAKAIGSGDWNSIAGMLGAAQRRARNHFDREYGPWHRRWATEDDQVRLTMPRSAAVVVLDEAQKFGDR